jgi:hypothetical protein
MKIGPSGDLDFNVTLFHFGKYRPSMLKSLALWTILEPFIDLILDWTNRLILPKYNPVVIKRVFDELDIFWLRNAESKSYSESDVRLITLLFLQSMEDRKLTRKELLAFADFIQRKWAPEIALGKTFEHTEEVIEARIEATVDQAIIVYQNTHMEKPITPEEFIANSAELVFHEPDGSTAQELLGGAMEIKSKWMN